MKTDLANYSFNREPFFFLILGRFKALKCSSRGAKRTPRSRNTGGPIPLSSGRGFTLVETVIVISIFAIASLALIEIFLGHNDLFRLSRASVNTNAASRMIADRIVSSVREADQVLAAHDFSGVTYSSGPDTLVLRIKSVDASNDFISGAFDYIAYYLDPTDSRKLNEIIEASASSRRLSATRLLSEAVEGLNFVYDNPDYSLVTKVDLAIILAEDFRQTSATSTVKVRAKLRNRDL